VFAELRRGKPDGFRYRLETMPNVSAVKLGQYVEPRPVRLVAGGPSSNELVSPEAAENGPAGDIHRID